MLRTCLAFAVLLALPAAARAKSRLEVTDEQAVLEYELNAAKVDKLTRVGVKLSEYAKAHPEQKRPDLMKGSLDDSVKGLKANAEVSTVLRSEGLAPRDFVIGFLAMMQAQMMTSIRAQYADTMLPDNINPKNVEFLERHRDLKEKWMKAWQIGAAQPTPGGDGQATGR